MSEQPVWKLCNPPPDFDELRLVCELRRLSIDPHALRNNLEDALQCSDEFHRLRWAPAEERADPERVRDVAADLLPRMMAREGEH